VIISFTAIINFSSLGVFAFRTFIRLCNLNKNIVKDIVKYLKNTYQVGWGVTIIGIWDINFIFWTRDVSEFSNFWKTFYFKFDKYIDDKVTNLVDWSLFYPKAFLVPKYFNEIPEYIFLERLKNKIKLDNTDLKILALLANNSRISVNDISKIVNLSPTTIFSKIKFFEKEKIILAYNIGINVNKLGYTYFKLHLNLKNFNKKRYDELLGYFHYQENIWSVANLLGGDDIELDMYVKNEEQYLELLTLLRSKFSDIIKNYNTIKYYEEFKYNLFPIDV
jgi:Lrp/AsnC family leucine-responsive transcriptional regulator